MIAYDDLVVALSSWRAGQGLPPTAVNFLSADTGSVDLALPVADPVEAMELETGEVQALDDDYAIDEYAVDEDAVDEDAADAYPVDEYAVEEASVSDDPFGAEASDDAADSMEAAVPLDDSASPVHALNYDDDDSEQTAIASDFETVTAYGESASADDAVLSVSDEESDQAMESLAGEPRTEEVDVLSEELAAGEEEGPTQFGNLDREATEMGIGIDSLRQPGPPRDPADSEE